MKRICIIGAGPAGLTAAYELLKSGKEYEVVIFEQSNAIGGLAKSIFHNGHGIDIGGHKFKSKDAKVKEWWNNIMPLQGEPSVDDALLNRFVKLNNGGPNPNVEDGVMLNRRASSSVYLSENYFDYPIKMTQDNFAKLGANASAKASFSMLGGTIVKRKEKSVEDTYINRFGRFMYATFFEGYTEKLLGHTPNEVSTEWADVEPDYIYAPTLRGIRASKEADDSTNEEFCYPKYGPGYFWETVAMKVTEMGGTIYKNCRVEKVNTEGNTVTGVTYVNNGQSNYLEADEVISTMPIKYMVREMDNLPTNIQEIVHRLQYRDYVAVGVLVPAIKLKNTKEYKNLNNMSTDGIIYIHDKNCKMARVRIGNNWSPYLITDIHSSVWITVDFFCNAGDFYWNMNDQAWKDMAIAELKKVGIIDEAEVVMDAVKIAEESVIPGYYETYNRMPEVIEYLNQFHNLYCIGRNGQHRVMNMDIAMKTAFEAVKNIEMGVKTKKNIWDASAPRENILAEKKEQEEIRRSYKKDRPVAYNTALLNYDDEPSTPKSEPVIPTAPVQPEPVQVAEPAYVEEPAFVPEPVFEEQPAVMPEPEVVVAPVEVIQAEVAPAFEEPVIMEPVAEAPIVEEAPVAEPEPVVEEPKLSIVKEETKSLYEGPDAMDKSLAPKIDIVEEPKLLQRLRKARVIKESNVETVVVERPKVEIPIELDDEMSQPTEMSADSFRAMFEKPEEPETPEIKKENKPSFIESLIPIKREPEVEEPFMATSPIIKDDNKVDSIIASNEALRPQSERIVSFENMSEADAVEIWERQTLNSSIILTQEEALRMEMAKLQNQESTVKVAFDPAATTVIKEEPLMDVVKEEPSLIIKQEQKPLTPLPKPEPKKEVSQEEIARAIANGKVIKSTKVRTSVSATKKDGIAPRPIRDDDYAKKITRR